MADQINLNEKETVALIWGTANVLTPGQSCPNITYDTIMLERTC